MSFTTFSENAARSLAFFGIAAVAAMFAVALFKAGLVADVYDNAGTFADPSDPATSSDPATRADWQDAQTITGWEGTLRFLGLGSILTAIILTFGVTIYRGVKLLSDAFPEFWRGYLAVRGGRRQPLPERVKDDVELPFGGGA